MLGVGPYTCAVSSHTKAFRRVNNLIKRIRRDGQFIGRHPFEGNVELCFDLPTAALLPNGNPETEPANYEASGPQKFDVNLLRNRNEVKGKRAGRHFNRQGHGEVAN